MSDHIVKKLIQLHKKLEDAASVGANMVDGWRLLHLDIKGWVVAGKNIDGVYRMRGFFPAGQWKKAVEYLKSKKSLDHSCFLI